jgi:hypothetical protein
MVSRKGEFASGASSGPSETASLLQRAARFNSLDPGKFQANGLNQQIMLSPNNGNSATDAERQTPGGQLPSSNGMSLSTYNQVTPRYGMSLNL